MTEMGNFEVLAPDEVIPPKEHGKRGRTGWMAVVTEGQRVFVPLNGHSHNYVTSSRSYVGRVAKSMGAKGYVRTSERNGVPGFYAWIDAAPSKK